MDIREIGKELTVRVLLEDGFSVEKGTGVGRYTTQNLAREMGKHSDVEILLPPAGGWVQKIRPLNARRVAYAAWLETVFRTQVERLKANLTHFTNYFVPCSCESNAKYVASIHA